MVLATTPLSGTAATSGRLQIGDDHGGKVSDRQRQIAILSRSGKTVAILGEHCLSSCTMLLALPNLCIHPKTVFGFHGPSDYGAQLPPVQFEYWSQIIASHYPPGLRSWYLREARFTLSGYYYLTGSQLAQHYGFDLCGGKRIGMGIPEYSP